MPTPATTVAFDTHQDLLWAGNDYGRVCSFFGPELQRYTSYRAHPSPEGPVKQLLFCDKGVLSISVRSVHLASRRGLTQWHLTNDAFKDLRCMSFTSKGVHEVLVAGCQDTMFRIDVEKGTLTETLPAENSYTMMKKGGQYICAATTTGMVQIIDPLTFKVVKSWQAHKEWINDMDAKSDFLVTCGYSRRQLNNLILDPFAYVYDLKTLLPLPPIPFHVGAAFVRMHPRMSTTSIVSSQSGQLQVVDLMNPNTANVRQVNLYDTYLTCLEMAPSGEALALTDAMSSVRIWGSPTKVRFTDQSQPTEFPDHIIPSPKLDWSMDTPLSTIGMPYYRETLLSVWPSHMIFEVGAPPPKIDSQVQASLKRAEMGQWAPNPRKLRRNQVQSTRLPEKDNPLKAPKFLSEKARDGNGSNQAERRMSETLEALTDMMLDGATKKDVPVMYRNVEIKYSRFGVDDFDFKRPGASLVHELVYPPKNTMKNPMRASRPTFSQILKASVERQDQNRGWCDRCKRYQQLAARKTIQNVPPILMINAAIHSHEAKQLWATPNWLPEKIGIIVNQGQFFCYEGQDLEHHLRRNFYDIQVYELVGVVADINSGENQKSHLVSMINVAPSSRTDEAETKWHLFNDFLVRPVTKEEALRFEPNWKLPSVLTYESVKASHHIDDSWKESLDTSLLYRTWGPNESDNLEYKPLHPNEHPGPGWPVAIDAEFVSLQREEIEISASGQRETIRPSRLGLARVSVLRGGDGEDEGKPFIDDYIAITEPIVDYLTLFSGISPGDLDRATSKHALVGLKVAYKKLWLLLNLGCLFIGHGLPKDFRTINIHVPKAQVVDTVDLYYIPARQRKLSLRFLAWIVLEEDIQQDTHDSVEDARTALKLWRHWRAVEDGEGKAVCDEMVKDIYKRGWEVGFKVPRVGGGGTGGARGDAMTPEPSVAGASTPTRAAAGTPVRPGTGGWRPPPGVSFGSPSPMK
ncbi:PAB-dependent poly(A)-specific ribonuclease subunit PAN2 [Neofusicoccum parvum]|uniref:PAB-dependent poly(A)-specific ribonuclease subunit PAN2 n=1 Tax=Neofusicoccum parvum TaxID=310453 RepID=A0ACB5RVL0_9PEZI|nr:PAB-dependent poly(A)-specific ribonuclease subunit PAN2 [Neofusicoccum parvum]